MTREELVKMAGNAPTRFANNPIRDTMYQQFLNEAPAGSIHGKADRQFKGWTQKNNMPEPPPKTKEPNPKFKTGSLSDSIINDFIEGARRNKTARVQVGDVTSETKIASAGMTPLDTAKLSGALYACKEAEFTLEEASQILGIPVELAQAVLNTVK